MVFQSIDDSWLQLPTAKRRPACFLSIKKREGAAVHVVPNICTQRSRSWRLKKKSGFNLWQPCNISTEERKECRSSRGWRVAAAKCTEGEKEARSWCPDRSRRGWKQTPGSHQLPVYPMSSFFPASCSPPPTSHPIKTAAPWPPGAAFSSSHSQINRVSSSSSSSPRFITFNYLNYPAPYPACI